MGRASAPHRRGNGGPHTAVALCACGLRHPALAGYTTKPQLSLLQFRRLRGIANKVDLRIIGVCGQSMAYSIENTIPFRIDIVGFSERYSFIVHGGDPEEGMIIVVDFHRSIAIKGKHHLIENRMRLNFQANILQRCFNVLPLRHFCAATGKITRRAITAIGRQPGAN